MRERTEFLQIWEPLPEHARPICLGMLDARGRIDVGRDGIPEKQSHVGEVFFIFS